MIRCAVLLASASLLTVSLALGRPEPHAQQDPLLYDPLPETGWLHLVQSYGGVFFQRKGSAAFSIQRRSTVHPESDGGKARHHFEGFIRIDQAGRYRFGFDGQGIQQSMEIWNSRGKTILSLPTTSADITDWVDLNPGRYRTRITVLRATPRAIRFQAMWEMEQTPKGGFPMEPIPVTSVNVSNLEQAQFRAGQFRNRGRLLLEEQGCTNCHTPGEKSKTAVGVRPAPILDRLAERAAPAWVERWLVDPAAVRPGADMPALLGTGEAAAEEARAITHFLYASAAAAPGGPVATEAAVLARGRELFHTIGCVACHGALESPRDVFGDDQLSAEVPEVDVTAPFGDLNGKWRPAALAAFLVDPAATYPDGRMPSLGLSKEEADFLATYLASRWGVDEAGFEPDAALVERGRELFGQRNCHACHALAGFEEMPVEAPELDKLNVSRGCLSKTDADAPRYELDMQMRSALEAGVEAAKSSNGVAAPTEVALRKIESLACKSCHAMHGEGGVPDALSPYFVSTDDRVDLGDEGRLPPDLHHPGFKLTTTWLRDVLVHGKRARPYLSVRMPDYGRDHVGTLPGQLARIEGVLPDSDVEPPESTDELVLAGRRLMGHEALGCMTCHVYKEYPPTGTPGPAITDFAHRLRYDWFRVYMQNPQRFKPGSRMPDFGTGGVSSLRTVLGGDMAKQVDAMWAYFQLGDAMPAPEGVEPGSGMQVQVGDRPVVMRTFLKDAGSRGVAIGFPNGVHFGFDAAEARLVSVWRGDFLDASGAWAGRGGGVTGGRGEVVWTAPERTLLLAPNGEDVPALLAKEGAEARYRGYRLDGAGHPTMLYSLGSVRVSERFEGRLVPSLAIVRRFELAAEPGGALPAKVWVTSGVGGTARAEAGCSIATTTVVDGLTWHLLTVAPGATAVVEIEARP